MSVTPAFPAPRPLPLSTVLSGRTELWAVTLAALIGLSFALSEPAFTTAINLAALANQAAVVGIAAVGLTFVVLTRGIDFSVGAVAALSGVVFGLAAQSLPMAAAAALALGTGLVIGSLSGVLIGLLNLPAYAATLGMMAVARSLADLCSGQKVLTAIPVELRAVAGTPSAGLLLLLAICALGGVWLRWSRAGLALRVMGASRDVVRRAGFRAWLLSVLPYGVSGALAGAAALVAVGQRQLADPAMGNGLELYSLASVLIGGISLRGGRGTLIGTLAGVATMVMLRNGLNLAGVSTFGQGLAIGALVVAALCVERLTAPASASRS